jgi:hypothetical protein
MKKKENQQQKIKNQGERGRRWTRKRYEDDFEAEFQDFLKAFDEADKIYEEKQYENDFEAEFQAFSKAFDEVDKSYEEFMALCHFKNNFKDDSPPSKENDGFTSPNKGK